MPNPRLLTPTPFAKLLIIALVAALSLSLWPLAPTPATAEVPPRTQAKVCRDTLTVYATPTLDFRNGQLATLNFGDVINVITDRVDYYRYAFSEIRTADGVQGFVLRAFLTDYPPYATTTGEVNLRTEPSATGELLTTLAPATLVEALATDDRRGNGGLWVQVRVVESGQVGWVFGSYLRNPREGSSYGLVCDLPATAAQDVPLQAVVRGFEVEVGDRVPVWDSNLATRLDYGAVVTVLQLDAELRGPAAYFSYVRVEETGQEGWVRTGHLRLLPFEVVATGGNPYYLRTAPDINAPEIMLLPGFVGCFMVVEAVDNGPRDSWYRIEAQDGLLSGWIYYRGVAPTSRERRPTLNNQTCG